MGRLIGTVLLSLLLLTGCGYIQDEDAILIQIGAVAGNLSDDYETLVELVDEMLVSDFIPDESKAVLRSVIKKSKTIVTTFEEVRDGKHLSDVELYKLFSSIKAIYIQGRPIIVAYFEAAGEDPDPMLLKFDIDALRLDKLVTAAEQSYNANVTAVNSLYSFITNIFRLLIAAAATAL